MRFALDGPQMAPVPATSSTMLMLVNNQLGFRDEKAWGNGHSNPSFEENTVKLLDVFRQAIKTKPEGERPRILHCMYRPVWTDHPLHVSNVGPYGPDGEEKRGIDFLEFSVPLRCDADGKPKFMFTFDEPELPPASEVDLESIEGPPEKKELPAPERDEILMTSHGHSPFINTPLIDLLNKRGIKTLFVAGMGLEHGVSTTLRSAKNLALVGRWGGKGNMVDAPTSLLYTEGEGMLGDLADCPEPDSGWGFEGLSVQMPRLILVEDATRAFGRGGFDAQTIHGVHVEGLKDFAEVRSTSDVVAAVR